MNLTRTKGGKLGNLTKICQEARREVLRVIYEAQTSHIGSNFSAIEIMAVIFDRLDFKHDKFIDIYDSYNINYKVKYKKKGRKQIDYGADWKQDLIDKAKKTGIYKNLIVHDNNKPLPLKNNHFDTISNNTIYSIK